MGRRDDAVPPGAARRRVAVPRVGRVAATAAAAARRAGDPGPRRRPARLAEPDLRGAARWVRAAWQASQHGQAMPPMPSGAVGSRVGLLASVVPARRCLRLTVLGVLGWLRFSSAALRGGRRGRLPPPPRRGRDRAAVLRARSSARSWRARRAASCLPAGPRGAAAPSAIGWGLVAAGEVGVARAVRDGADHRVVGVGVGGRRGAARVAWVAAALVLPPGSRPSPRTTRRLDVRRGTAYS